MKACLQTPFTYVSDMRLYGYSDYCVNSNFHYSDYIVFKLGFDHVFRSVNSLFLLAIALLWKIALNTYY